MALKKRGKYRYGDSQKDIRAEILRYSKENEYVAQHFADAVCQCGGRLFSVLLDENEGAAARTCIACDHQHPIGDSEEYLDDAELGQCACPCEKGPEKGTQLISRNELRPLYGLSESPLSPRSKSTV